MRNCPHCSRQIQDEAIYCRYCHRELEPAMWIAAMRKCPYCAEWIEGEDETCQYCGKTSEPAGVEHTPPFVAARPDDFSQQLRRSLLSEDAAEPFQPTAELDPPSSRLSLLRPRPETRAEARSTRGRATGLPGTEDSGEFRKDSVWATAVEAGPAFRAESGPIFRAEPAKPRRVLPGGLLRMLIAIVVLGGVGFLIFTLAQGPAAAFFRGADSTVIPGATSSALSTPTPRVAPTLPPATESVVATAPSATGIPDCLSWEQVSVDDEGTELCAYGVIKRWFAAEEIPFVAIFSEEAGTFAIIDRTMAHPVGPGDCILARGVVVIMSGTRPNIDAAGNLERCSADSEEG